ncbi:MAG: hypothetical protein HOP19_12750 [Acidobacteria bacterium]|nr:hypothetical protein [Acidobacteriota bacterium]
MDIVLDYVCDWTEHRQIYFLWRPLLPDQVTITCRKSPSKRNAISSFRTISATLLGQNASVSRSLRRQNF